MQYFEKFSSTVKQLAIGSGVEWTGKKCYWLEKGEKVGDGRPEWSSSTADREQAAVSVISDADGTSSGSLLDSVLCTLLKKLPRDVWVVAFLLIIDDMIAQIAFWMAVATFMYCSTFYSPVPQQLTELPQIKKIPLPFPVLWNSSVLQSLLFIVSLSPPSGTPIPWGLH